MARTTVNLPDELDEQIEMNLSYGDSKSQWVRQAIRFRMHVDPILDEVYETHQREERLQLVEKAVRDKVDDMKKQADRGNGN